MFHLNIQQKQPQNTCHPKHEDGEQNQVKNSENCSTFSPGTLPLVLMEEENRSSANGSPMHDSHSYSTQDSSLDEQALIDGQMLMGKQVNYA